MRTDWNGDTGLIAYSALREFTTAVPPHLAPYHAALSLFPESPDASADGLESGFRPVHNAARSCNGRVFGAADKPDLVFRICQPKLKDAMLRTSAALLEVGDTLVPVAWAPVTWSSAASSACLATEGEPARRE